MSIQSNQIGYLRKRVRYTAGDLGLGAVTALQDAADASIGWGGFIVTNGAVTKCGLMLPFDLDPNYDIGFRFCTACDIAGIITPVVTWHKQLVDPETLIAVTGVTHTALSTVVATNTHALANSFKWTSRGVATAASLGLTRDAIELGILLRMAFTWTVTTATEAQMVVLELDYARAPTDEGPTNNPPLKHNL